MREEGAELCGSARFFVSTFEKNERESDMEQKDPKERILGYLLNKFLTEPARLETVDEWARDLGISKKTIYKYFPGKEYLIAELFTTLLARQQRWFEELEAGNQSSVSKLFLLVQHFKTVLEYLPGSMIVQLEKHHRKVNRIWEQYKADVLDQLFVRLIDSGKKQQHLVPQLNSLFVARFWETCVRTLVIQMPFLSMMSTAQAFDEMREIFFRGICTAEGLRELENARNHSSQIH